MALADQLARLFGVSPYKPAPMVTGNKLDSEFVERVRERHGGQLGPRTVTRPRWYLSDVETAQVKADLGDFKLAAQLMKAARGDGTYAGVLSTRTGGLVRLPKMFYGKPEIVDRLQPTKEKPRSEFDEMHPPTELEKLASDGIELGIGVAELVYVEGRRHPILVRQNPEHLEYKWEENRWYFRSVAGPIPITPGDGQWVLHLPGGQMEPWQFGLWQAIAKAYIRKTHAQLRKDNWEGKLANPARVAVAPHGATEEQAQSWFNSVMAWGVNTVFGLKPGYDIKLVESNGTGHESFQESINDQNREFQITVAGQTVTTDGGAGFQNSDIHKSIRADLIKKTGDSLAHTINTQTLPYWVAEEFGVDAVEDGGVAMGWNVEPPKDRNSEASAEEKAAQAITQLTAALAEHGLALDAAQVATRYGIPLVTDGRPVVPAASLSQVIDLARDAGLRPDEGSVRRLAERAGVELEKQPEGDERVPIELAPTDLAKIVRAREGRASAGLKPFGDDRDDMTISEMGEKAEAAGEVEVVEAEAEEENNAPTKEES